MKIIAVLSSLLLMAGSAMALPLSDPFGDATAIGGSTYLVGGVLSAQNLGGSNVWATLGSVNGNSIEPTIVAGNLSYPNLPASTGNSIFVQPATAMSARLNITNGSGTISAVGLRAYYSLLLKVTDITAVPSVASTNQICGFSDGVAGQPNRLARLGAKLMTKKVSGGFVIGLGRDDVTTDMVYDTTVHTTNETLFIVCSHENAGGGTTNEYMWINPSTNSFGAATAPTPTLTNAVTGNAGSGALSAVGVQGFVILCQYNIEPSAIIDELRIGTNWSYVTGGDPAIVNAPANQIVVPGANAVFNVGARGTGTLSYQWFKTGVGALSNGGNILGSGTTSLTVSSVSSGDLGSYYAMVTNGVGVTATSPFATLSMADPAVTLQPVGVTKDYGTGVTFHVEATGSGTLTYQWLKAGGGLSNGGNISGSQSDTLTLTNLSYLDADSYSVVVTGSNGSATSSDAPLVVRDPIIVNQPAATSALAGGTATFHVDAAGSGDLIYAWYKNGAIMFSGNGVTTPTLTLNNVSATDVASYSVHIQGDSGQTVISSSPLLTIAIPAAIYGQPTARMVPSGGTTTMAVGVSGTTPLFFQWYHEGTNVPGGTSIGLTLSNADATVTGNYFVVVSNSLSVVTSTVAAVNISASAKLFATNLAIVRVGSGGETLGTTGNSLFLDQYTQSGQLLNTITVPNSGSSGMVQIGFNNANGTTGNVTGTGLTRSANGQELVLAGYCTNLNNIAALATSIAKNIPRGIGVFNAAGQYNLALAATNGPLDGNLWRLALSDGTNSYWGTGNQPGLTYVGLDAPYSLVESNFMNIRSAGIFNGNIYCVGAVAGLSGINVVNGGGMPKTFVGATVLTNIPGSTSSGDMEMNAGGTIIYIANDNAAAGGIERYDYNGTTWAYSYIMPVTGGARYVTADFSGANPVVYAITKEADNNSIVQINDTGSGSTGTAIAWAGGNQVFRGVRLGPIQGPPTITVNHDSSNIILSWSGVYTLQSSIDVSSGYTDVTTNSPYTNNVVGDAQHFYRLHQ